MSTHAPYPDHLENDVLHELRVTREDGTQGWSTFLRFERQGPDRVERNLRYSRHWSISPEELAAGHLEAVQETMARYLAHRMRFVTVRMRRRLVREDGRLISRKASMDGPA